MQRLVVMVGLPGSGKSFYAENQLKSLRKEAAWKVVSSDQIREEILGDAQDQSHNDLVFREFYERMNLALVEGYSVILDATNVTRKSRSRIFSNLNFRGQLQKEAWIMNVPIEQCLYQNRSRSRVVEEKVIRLFEKSFQVPQYFEGFDVIKLCRVGLEPATSLDVVNFQQLLESLKASDQNNPHHEFTLGEHCSRCANYTKDQPWKQGLLSTQLFQVVGILHDVGKLLTKTTDKQGVSHFYNHAEVGSYYLISYPQVVAAAASSLANLQISHCEFFEILFYINYHMLAHSPLTESSITKYKRLFGVHRWENLEIFKDCDEWASKSS